MDDTIKKFFELRDKYWNSQDGESFVFLKHIWVYFFEYRNILNKPKKIIIPGRYDLVKSDKILSELGYRRYSINNVLCNNRLYTEIIFRNTL